jgi:hypothetical protein
MHQVEENIRIINKWVYIVDIENINDIHHTTIYLHEIIVLHASHDEDWLPIHISPLCTYIPLDIHLDQWVTTFNNNMNHKPHLGFFLEIGEGLYGDVGEKDYWHFH